MRDRDRGTARFTVNLIAVDGPLSGRGTNDDPGHGNDAGTTSSLTARAGQQPELNWKLYSAGHRYDFVVTADSDASFSRRIAGRVETGRHSVSGPATGLAGRFRRQPRRPARDTARAPGRGAARSG